jgi:hypothetical protein
MKSSLLSGNCSLLWKNGWNLDIVMVSGICLQL